MLCSDSTKQNLNFFQRTLKLLFNFVKTYNRFFLNLTTIYSSLVNQLLVNTFFLPRYYRVAEGVWQEGLLMDFLQKKVLDKWLRRFVIHSANLFSEKFFFEWVIRFFIDLITWPGTKFFIFEITTISSLFTFLTVIFAALFLNLNLIYLFLITIF